MSLSKYMAACARAGGLEGCTLGSCFHKKAESNTQTSLSTLSLPLKPP
jgi:hypothetical protein